MPEETQSADYLRGRMDAISDDVKGLKTWKDSTESKMTKFETQLESVPDRVVDRIRAHQGRSPEPSGQSILGNGSTQGASDTGKNGTQDALNSPQGEAGKVASKIDPPPPKANPADQHNSATTEKEPPPTKQRLGFFQRLR